MFATFFEMMLYFASNSLCKSIRSNFNSSHKMSRPEDKASFWSFVRAITNELKAAFHNENVDTTIPS